MSKKVETKTAVQSTTTNKVPQKAFISSEREILHHVYKLLGANMIKNTSYNEDDPIFEKFLHSHIFHNIDSSGKNQDRCQPVGGHFHLVNIVESEGSEVPSIEVSPPMKLVKKKIGKNRFTTEAVKVENDDHVHEWEYLRSDYIKLRKLNPEAAKVQAALAAPASIPGIIG